FAERQRIARAAAVSFNSRFAHEHAIGILRVRTKRRAVPIAASEVKCNRLRLQVSRFQKETGAATRPGLLLEEGEQSFAHSLAPCRRGDEHSLDLSVFRTEHDRPASDSRAFVRAGNG